MAKKSERRRGFVSRWFRRLWWLRKIAVVGAVVGGVAKAVGGRRGGAAGGRFGDPGGSKGPAPIGGPSSPSPATSVTPPVTEGETVAATSAPTSGVRTLVSVPPLPDTNHTNDTNESNTSADELEDTTLSGSSVGARGETTAGQESGDRSWVEALDGGECPPSHPVKANDSSGIYHVPGGRFYNRTVPQRCYASAEAAEADGYRPAKA